jgi:hypothetical protein
MSKLKESVFDKMKKAVYEFMVQHFDITDEVAVTLNDVYIVWTSKALQNWRALISTTLPDGRYYDCVYTGDDNTLTINTYIKYENKHLQDDFRGVDRIEKLKALVEKYVYDEMYGMSNSDLLFSTSICQNDKYVFYNRGENNNNMLFELTANGNTSEIYFDAYKPFDIHIIDNFMTLEEK